MSSKSKSIRNHMYAASRLKYRKYTQMDITMNIYRQYNQLIIIFLNVLHKKLLKIFDLNYILKINYFNYCYLWSCKAWQNLLIVEEISSRTAVVRPREEQCCTEGFISLIPCVLKFENFPCINIFLHFNWTFKKLFYS